MSVQLFVSVYYFYKACTKLKAFFYNIIMVTVTTLPHETKNSLTAHDYHTVAMVITTYTFININTQGSVAYYIRR
jgi:hypothetical protein